jgi:hypothetical protein
VCLTGVKERARDLFENSTDMTLGVECEDKDQDAADAPLWSMEW